MKTSNHRYLAAALMLAVAAAHAGGGHAPADEKSGGGHAAQAEEKQAAPAKSATSASAKTAARGAAKEKEAEAAPPEALAPADAMEQLRRKLTEKLSATPVAQGSRGSFDLRVASRPPTPEAATVLRKPVIAAAAAPVAPAAPAPAAHAHWDYAGTNGPEAWARLNPEFAKCGSGERQSPIDIRGGIRVNQEAVQFDYRASGFAVVDNGHTVQVNVGPGNSIIAMGRRYDLVQFHFHRPSEERIDGKQFDMVAHLVHKDADGKLAVVAVLLDRGSAQPLVQTVWNNLPLEKGDTQPAPGAIDLTQLLPEDRRYYAYMGSLTTPPCSEGVLWMVMKKPVGISADQIAIFSRLYPMNARPIQSVAGRLIKESE